ncbi:hypothetical protein FO519_005574 [Halicephalobus sp. NKZ332]|nr:hypothetical protein FO519_005574 [Halicephalobus sp. NKZ332]
MSLPSSEVFDRFDIEFDAGEDPVFHGGELITGSIKARLKERITIKVIRIQFKGRACWLGDHAKNAEIEKVFFDKDFILLERPPGRPEPGHFPWVANFTYSLPFQFPFPKGCPTSYESPQAFIRYFARATLITDEVDATQYVIKKGFTVISPPELHELLPPHSEPAEVEEVTTYGSCCCRGKVAARLLLPKMAYAPGEKVIGTFSVNNRNPKILDQIEVRLVDQVSRVEGEGEKKKRKTTSNRTLVLRKLDKTDVQKGKGVLQLDQVHLLTIPPVPSTTIQPEPSVPGSPEFRINRNDQVSNLLQSPSTATLKMRKQPFLKVNYNIQVGLGNKVLIDIPINVHPIPLYEHGVEFKPFVGGLQNFHEVDESDKKAVNPPFKFEPRYPVYVESPPPMISITDEPGHELTITANGDVELNRSVEVSDLPNGDKVILTKEEIVIVHNEEHPKPGPLKNEVQHTVQASHHTVPEQHTTETETQPIVEEKDSDSVIIHENPQDDERTEVIMNGENGTVKNITTVEYDEGDAHTEKVIETYSYTDENGVRVEVQKTTESTTIHHESPVPQE